MEATLGDLPGVDLAQNEKGRGAKGSEYIECSTDELHRTEQKRILKRFIPFFSFHHLFLVLLSVANLSIFSLNSVQTRQQSQEV